MLNKDLFADKRDAEIARLKIELERKDRVIEKFKKYDTERKKYYANTIQRLGELEAFVDEMEDKQGLECKLKRCKERISYLEHLVRAKNIQEDMSMEEIKSLISNSEYKVRNKELQNRVSNLSMTVSELTNKIEKMEREKGS